MSLIERAAEKLSQLGENRSTRKDPTSTIEAAQARLRKSPPAEAPPLIPDAVATLELPTLESHADQKPLIEPNGFAPKLFRKRESRTATGPGLKREDSGTRFKIDLARMAAAGLITPDAPRSQIASEFRVIKRPLIANVKGKSGTAIQRPNLIMVTSAMPGEGKSFTALNLAMSVAMELDNTVLLVDGDVAQPSLSRMLELPPSKGLIEVLSDSRLALQDVLLKTNVDKLTILPAGSPHERNTELLASEGMNSLLDEIAQRYSDRIVIFDSPPLLATTESPVLANHMGQIVVVVEAMKTTHAKMLKALSTIEACPVVMMVLNKSTSSDVGDYYGYYPY